MTAHVWLPIVALSALLTTLAVPMTTPSAAARWGNHGGYARGHERHDWGRGGGGGGGGGIGVGGALLGFGLGAVVGSVLAQPPAVVYAAPPAYYAPAPVYYGY